MLMAIFMKESGRMIKLMELVDIITKMERNIKESGKKINNKDLEKNLGQMVRIIKDNMKMERNMERDFYNL